MSTIVNDLGRWRVNAVPTVSDGKNTEVFGKWIVGDAASHRIGELDEDTQTEWGEPMRVQVVTGILHDKLHRLGIADLQLDVESNAGGWLPDPDDICEAQVPVGTQSLDGSTCDLGTAGQFDIDDTDYPDEALTGVKIGITKIDNTESYTFLDFVVTGTDGDGAAASETMTGLTFGTVLESDTYWSAITDITITAASLAMVTSGSDTFSVGIVSPARMSLEVSHDGQRNWSTARWRKFDTFSRVRWNLLGAGRQTVFRFTCDEAVKRVFLALWGSLRGRAH